MSRTKRIPPPPAIPAALRKEKGPTAAPAVSKPPATPRITPRLTRRAPVATAETVAARLMGLSRVEGGLPALWQRDDFHAELSATERPHLDAALARLRATGRLVALRYGKSEYFAYADALHVRAVPPAPAPAAPPVPPVPADGLAGVYRRLVRESGGFPDVKIAQLARGIGPAAARDLPEKLTAMWHAGDAVLSLGDWSLASEETRAAALELDGEKYLLVRFVGT